MAITGQPYAITRRTRHKRNGTPLSGYAIDLTIRVNSQGAYFLQDHNADRNVMPLEDWEDLERLLTKELRRNHREHFGSL